MAAGNGDWAAAQAAADPGADWAALELRHDRVYSIFTHAVLRGCANLSPMGGDAAAVLRHRVAAGTMAETNFLFSVSRGVCVCVES